LVFAEGDLVIFVPIIPITVRRFAWNGATGLLGEKEIDEGQYATNVTIASETIGVDFGLLLSLVSFTPFGVDPCGHPYFCTGHSHLF